MAWAIGHRTFLRRGSPGGSKGLEATAPFAYQVPMKEPSPRSSRLVLAGALLAAIAVGGAGFLLGRAATERAPVAVSPPAAVPAPRPAPEPVLSGALGRAGLIALAASAADAVAAGLEPGSEVAQADGRRFELRLPFGCGGPASESSREAMRWRYDREAGALRIHVTPATWTAQDWWPADSAGGVEAIQGFWIERPWTSSETCPGGGDRPVAAGPEPVTLPGQSLAIGQLFLGGGGRGGRRDGKPYEAVVRVEESDLKTQQGFRLRIGGRIARTPGGGPVSCRQPAGPEQRPICLVSVVMDEIAIENPATGEILATWSPGARDTPED